MTDIIIPRHRPVKARQLLDLTLSRHAVRPNTAVEYRWIRLIFDGYGDGGLEFEWCSAGVLLHPANPYEEDWLAEDVSMAGFATLMGIYSEPGECEHDAIFAWALTHGIAPYQPFKVKFTTVSSQSYDGEWDSETTPEVVYVSAMEPQALAAVWQAFLLWRRACEAEGRIEAAQEWLASHLHLDTWRIHCAKHPWGYHAEVQIWVNGKWQRDLARIDHASTREEAIAELFLVLRARYPWLRESQLRQLLTQPF